jgi:hypothetical protein
MRREIERAVAAKKRELDALWNDFPLKMRREIERAAATEKSEVDALRKDFRLIKAALQKDFHLIEAAIANDRTVVSLDENVRRLFRTASRRVVAIKKVVWVNPVNTAEESITWLQKGAKPENVRMLEHTVP